MTPEEKNKIVLGQLYTVPTVVERKQTNADGKIETVEEDGEETLTLRPIRMNQWNDLQQTKLTEFESKLIALTARKSVEWVENNLNPSVLTDLIDTCKEINAGFFAWLDRVKEEVVSKKIEFERIVGHPVKGTQSTSSASETSSPKLPTDTV